MSVAKDLEIRFLIKSCKLLGQFYPFVIYRGLSENLSSLGKSVEDTLEQYNGTEAAPADQDVEDMYANCAEEEVAESDFFVCHYYSLFRKLKVLPIQTTNTHTP